MDDLHSTNSRVGTQPWACLRENELYDGNRSGHSGSFRSGDDSFWENRVAASGNAAVSSGRKVEIIAADPALSRPISTVSPEQFNAQMAPRAEPIPTFLDFFAKKHQPSVATARPTQLDETILNNLQSIAKLIRKNDEAFTNNLASVSPVLSDNGRASRYSPHFKTGNHSEFHNSEASEIQRAKNIDRMEKEIRSKVKHSSSSKTSAGEMDWSRSRKNYAGSRESVSSMDLSPGEDMEISPSESPRDLITDRRKRDRSESRNSRSSSHDNYSRRRRRLRDEDDAARESKRRRYNDTELEKNRNGSGEVIEVKKSSGHSRLAFDYISVGNLQTGLCLLNKQIGLVNFNPYRKFLYRSMLKSNVSYGTSPEFPSITQRVGKRYDNEGNLSVRMDVEGIEQRLDLAYKYAASAKFVEAIERFRDILLWIPLVIVENEDEERTMKESVKLCRAYIHALLMDLERKSLSDDSIETRKRCCELAAYVADCDLLPIHQMITLRVALTLSFKLHNYKMAAEFSKRLLKLGPKRDVAMLTEKVLEMANKNLEDSHELNYKLGKDYSVCGQLYKPIFQDEMKVSCPYCETSFVPLYKGSVCVVCKLAEIGKQTTGLVLLRH